MNNLIYGFLFILTVTGCNGRLKGNGQIECINKFISAVKNNDSTGLYRLVDTAFIFKVQSKESIDDIVKFVSRRLKNCESDVADSSIKINDAAPHHVEYTVPFCRGTNGQIVHGKSFDLNFAFSTYYPENLILHIELNRYEVKNTKPIIVPPQLNR